MGKRHLDLVNKGLEKGAKGDLPRLTWPAKRLLKCLAEFSNPKGETVLMFVRIRERTGLPQWGVNQALRELEDAGLVEQFNRTETPAKPLAPGARLKLPGDQPGAYPLL